MNEIVLFHHNSSIYNEDWSKPGFDRVCSNPRYIYYYCIYNIHFWTNLCKCVVYYVYCTCIKLHMFVCILYICVDVDICMITVYILNSYM